MNVIRWCLPLLLALVGCGPNEAERRKHFASDAQVRADVVAHVAAEYAVTLPADAAEVSLGCTVMNSQCALIVRVDAEASGLPATFLVWPRYRQVDGGFELLDIEDDLRPRLLRQTLQGWFRERLLGPASPQMTLRLNESHGFVGIKDAVPRKLAELAALEAPTLLARHADDLGIELYVYVLAEPAVIEPQLREGLARLLAEPEVQALGKGLDVRWFFRHERPGVEGPDADHIVRDGDNRWLPVSTQDNTRAKWQLSLGGRRYVDDLTQPVDTLWPRIDRQEPMLTQ